MGSCTCARVRVLSQRVRPSPAVGVRHWCIAHGRNLGLRDCASRCTRGIRMGRRVREMVFLLVRQSRIDAAFGRAPDTSRAAFTSHARRSRQDCGDRIVATRLWRQKLPVRLGCDSVSRAVRHDARKKVSPHGVVRGEESFSTWRWHRPRAYKRHAAGLFRHVLAAVSVGCRPGARVYNEHLGVSLVSERSAPV